MSVGGNKGSDLATMVDNSRALKKGTTICSDDSMVLSVDPSILLGNYLDQNITDHSKHDLVTKVNNKRSGTSDLHPPELNMKLVSGSEHPEPQSCKICGLATVKLDNEEADMSRFHFLAAPLAEEARICNGHCVSNVKRKGVDRSYTSNSKKKLRRPTLLDGGRFECAHCGHVCTTKEYIRSHIMARHLDEKPYACDLCEFRSALKHSLRQHRKRHSDEKRFSCDMCDFATNYSGSLVVHKRVHSGEKPFACLSCEFKASTRGGLRNHIKTHTGERDFRCNECEYAARDVNKLRRHQMVHTGERPYPCSLCAYRTNQKSNLNVHIQKVHGVVKPKKGTPTSPLPPNSF